LRLTFNLSILVVVEFYPAAIGTVTAATTTTAAMSSTAATMVTTVSTAAAAAAATTSTDANTLAGLIGLLQTISSWDPYIIYGGLALGVYRTFSHPIEVLFERACYEVEKALQLNDRKFSNSNFQYFLF
jgi:hypothetical protein